MFRKIVNYLKALFGVKVEALMDPSIQLEQAVQEARRQDRELRESAARVIAMRSEVQLKLERTAEGVAKARAGAITALSRVDSATDAGERDRWERAASGFSMELTTQETLLAGLKTQYEGIQRQAGEAKDRVNQNALRLKQLSARQLEILSRLEQAKMQESVNSTLEQINRPMDAQHVPNFTEIEDKVNRRLSAANAAGELEADSLEGATRELEHTMAQVTASARLEELRAEMRGVVDVDGEAVVEQLDPGTN
jgi:phage shock protein A